MVSIDVLYATYGPTQGRDHVRGAASIRMALRCYSLARMKRLMRLKLPTFLCFTMAPLAHSQVVPTEFLRDRIFVVASAATGAPVRFLTDSGGGWNAISDVARARLKLRQEGDVELGDRRAPLVDASALFVALNIPVPVRDEPWLRGMLVVAPAAEFQESDGTLGSRWFAGHIWEIDYGRRTMRLLPSLPSTEGFREMPMGFAVDKSGQRALNFPRVTIAVDGHDIDVLLDTGASAKLTSGAAHVLGYEAGADVGTSFVIRSIFDQWKIAHPQWRTIPDADARGGYPMIEVPTVQVGGIDTGPVWFTQRPDPNFLEFMSQMMDEPVRGAIGGSALRHLRLVLDYPGAKMFVKKAATE